MIANLVTKVIDNIQLKISNVYIRIEDDLSIPRQPFALSLVIGSIQAQTMNENWEP
jgi:sporulation-control protein spo0M